MSRQPRVLVCGDAITDKYIFGRATRLCPEGPVPVIVPEIERESGGGACLVVKQLEALIGAPNVEYMFGSQSEKLRIFADNHLICRVDRDSQSTVPGFAINLLTHLNERPLYDLMVISDYDKGSFREDTAKFLMRDVGIPILVDAKNNFGWYESAFALFPNEKEDCFDRGLVWRSPFPPHIIRKLGGQGCKVNNVSVPLMDEHEVRDTTGAGDCFLAAFAAYMARELAWGIKLEEIKLESCARFANKVAARSVEFVGTHIVTDVKL